MEHSIYIPASRRTAGRQVRLVMVKPLEQLSPAEFSRAWCSLAYLFPGLHPDGYDDLESGWPGALRGFAAEAFRRADCGQLSESVLYPSDAQWAGLYDRMSEHTNEETTRRRELASAC